MSTLHTSSHADDGSVLPNDSVPHPQPTSTTVKMQSAKKSVSPAAQNTAKPVVPGGKQKKVSRRSSKPIINWFQRKLAGSGKTKRTENEPLGFAELAASRNAPNPPGRQMNRITSSPVPVQTHFLKQQTKPDASSLARRKTRSISLHGDEDLRGLDQGEDDDSASVDQYSLNRDSIWSPTSVQEADDDASVRPIPPSAPPSPSPSRSSSSYLSDPRTFRSMAASTKPTTLLSIDLNGNGMAHIAQAPTPPQQINRFAPHVRQSSSLGNAGMLNTGTSITFSALPSAQSSSRANSLRNPGSLSSIILNTPPGTSSSNHLTSVQAPLHTNHHPRNNPRPSSPPMDNASVLTLASSAFGIMPNRLVAQNYPPSAIGDSVSQYGGSMTFQDAESTSHYIPGDDDRLDDRDFDASVRALRPRSSRRGSWESEASGWSARLTGTGAPSLTRERSLWTTGSVRTGYLSTEIGDSYENDEHNQSAVNIEGETGGSVSETSTHLEQVDLPAEGHAAPPLVTVSEVPNELKANENGIPDSENLKPHIIPRASSETIDQAAISQGLPHKDEGVLNESTTTVDSPLVNSAV